MGQGRLEWQTVLPDNGRRKADAGLGPSGPYSHRVLHNVRTEV